MANPADIERMIGHGLDANAENPWVRRIVKKVSKKLEKSWSDVHTSNHAPANENDTVTFARNDNIPIPLHRILGEHLDQTLPLDETNEANRIVRDTVKQALHELLPADAMLYVSSEDFHRIHQDLQKQAEAYVKEAVVLASKHAKEIPVNKESVTRGLRRELASPKFKDRHYELLNAIARAKLPPEIGTARNA